MNSNNIALLYLLSLAVMSPLSADAPDFTEIEATPEWKEAPRKEPNMSDCDSVVLRIRDICAKNISTQCLKALRINNVKDILTNSLCAKTITAKSINTDTLCVNNSDVALENLSVNGDLCVTGTVNLGEICQAYRATVTYNANASYTLGTLLTFNDISDDPNHNVTLAPMTYTVPVSGYYIVNIQIDQNNLVTTGPILGTPTSKIDLIVNGMRIRTSVYPFLTFSNEQRSLLTALVRLNKGDIVQSTYRISVLDQTLGTIDLTGSVTILGDPIFSIFSIHYLSSACSPSSCSAVNVPCDTLCPDPCIR